MATHWILRVGDGTNFTNSSRHKIWGIQSTTCSGKHFINNVRKGDILWFVTSRSNGKLIAVVTYCSHNVRDFGPLIDVSMTNEELGWTGDGIDWRSDTEVHYDNLFNLSNCELYTELKGTSTIRKYDKNKIRINLPKEFINIVRYSRLSFEF